MRIGRISGFEVRLHWSTLIIFGLLVLSLATVQLPEDAPGYSDGAYIAAALLTGVAFYLSLLAHEVSHALVARRNGIEVESLTLWMLGGIATLKGEPSTPAADLRIAGVGPAVSLAAAVLFAAVAGGLELAADSSLLQATAGWLAGINAVLALFNLVPAAPLDGGRILRAALWWWRGDRTWAAVAATRAGAAFGYLLVGVGLVQLLGGDGGGLWLVFVGWYVVNAARSEQTQTLLRDSLRDLTVADVMTPDPVTAPDYITVQTLLDDYVLRTRHSAFPLVDFAGSPAGLVTLNQVRAVPAPERGDVRVRDVACSRDAAATADPQEPLIDVLPRLNSCSQGRLLVIADDHVVGIVTATDVTRALEIAGATPPIDLRENPRRADVAAPPPTAAAPQADGRS